MSQVSSTSAGVRYYRYCEHLCVLVHPKTPPPVRRDEKKCDGTQNSPPEQNVDPRHNREVHICFDLVRHVGPKTSPHNDVPAPPVGFLERFADARRDRCEYLFPRDSSARVAVADSGGR